MLICPLQFTQIAVYTVGLGWHPCVSVCPTKQHNRGCPLTIRPPPLLSEDLTRPGWCPNSCSHQHTHTHLCQISCKYTNNAASHDFEISPATQETGFWSMPGEEWLITVTTPLALLFYCRLVSIAPLHRENGESTAFFNVFWCEPRLEVENDGNSVKSQIKCELEHQQMKRLKSLLPKGTQAETMTKAASCTIPAAL